MTTIKDGSTVCITSDGAAHTTVVTVNGVRLYNVTSASWQVDARGLATATLELVDVELNVTLDGAQVTTEAAS